MNNIRTITLDLDDTLWAIHPVLKRAEERLYNWMSRYYPRITELFEPADLIDVRATVIAEHQDRVHDLTFLRRAILAHIGDGRLRRQLRRCGVCRFQ